MNYLFLFSQTVLLCQLNFLSTGVTVGTYEQLSVTAQLPLDKSVRVRTLIVDGELVHQSMKDYLPIQIFSNRFCPLVQVKIFVVSV